MDAFCFTRNGTCRTIDLLARRIGQRRDATRAPMQVRNGWRPSGRRLAQPAALSKNGRFFVQPMGSTSVEPTVYELYRTVIFNRDSDPAGLLNHVPKVPSA